MYSFRKNKKGFTLIELMVVVAIIGVLSLLGLRMYSGQQEKAKNAIVKANCGTIQTLIQAELADRPVTDLDSASELGTIIFANAGIFNPLTGNKQTTCIYATTVPTNATAPGSTVADGDVYVHYNSNIFYVNGNDTAVAQGKVFNEYLQARK